jgi:hypothetical protein
MAVRMGLVSQTLIIIMQGTLRRYFVIQTQKNEILDRNEIFD